MENIIYNESYALKQLTESKAVGSCLWLFPK